MPSSARRNVLIPRELPTDGFPHQPHDCSRVGRTERTGSLRAPSAALAPSPPKSIETLANSRQIDTGDQQ